MYRKCLGGGLLLAVAACQQSQPSESAIQTAIAATERSQPNLVGLLATPTSPPEPSRTPEPSSTPTSEPTLTPTPDIRVMRVDPKEFLLTKDDLPSEAKYYLPNAGWISPHRNSELISQMGQEEGQRYLEETGRVDGWWGYLKRGTSTVKAPDQMYSNPVMYESAAGAQSARTGDYGFREGMELVETDIELGELTQVWLSKEMQSNGRYWVTYLIDFTYRNYGVSVGGMGYESEVSLDFIEVAARQILAKLEAAPLSNP